jgi:prepilin-type N-terminal cleavage/methylation domain-containing protein
MLRIINKLKNKRGFTLIELIVVLAVLAIVMAIAIPKFMGVQAEARIKGDAATAQQIIKAARLQEASRNMTDGSITSDNWENDYMEYPSPKAAASGEDFELSYVSSKYKVTWKQNTGKFAETQSVTEGEEFKLDTTP